MPGLSSAAALRTADFRRILLIKFSALGDVVHTIPVVNKLRRRYPSAEIDWLVRPAFAELIAHHPAVSHAIPFPRRRWAGPLREQGPRLAALARLLLHLRSRRPAASTAPAPLRSARTSLRKRGPSSSSFSTAGRARWTCSIQSRS